VSEYYGKLLRVNLSSGKIANELISREDRENFIGGRGFGIKYLYQELKPGIEPLGEENKLILLNGPLAGTQAQYQDGWSVRKVP
jgi:aldehyde:ferredoxin oxidoreductase